eukprot:sb/3475065/
MIRFLLFVFCGTAALADDTEIISDWTAVEWDVEIPWDLEGTPLQIKTDSILGSNDTITIVQIALVFQSGVVMLWRRSCFTVMTQHRTSTEQVKVYVVFRHYYTLSEHWPDPFSRENCGQSIGLTGFTSNQ